MATRALSQAEVAAHGRAVIAGVHAHQVGHVVDQHQAPAARLAALWRAAAGQRVSPQARTADPHPA